MASTDSFIHTGVWTNWAHGNVYGATITLTTLKGGFLIAFLAVYIRVVGSHFWDILTWIIFHRRTTRQPRDGLHHQQQALLANTMTDTSAIWQFTRLGWAWRKRARNVFWRTSAFIVLGVFHFAAFTAAGIFSASVTSTRSEVLLTGSNCGTVTVPSGDPLSLPVRQADTEISAMLVKALRSAYQYATSCYDQSSLSNTVQSTCNAYGRRNVNWTVDIVPGCPFAQEMCVDQQSVLFDTGQIDSTLDLGINSKPEDRVTFRNVMQCSPIKTDGFVTGPYDNVTGLVAMEPAPGASQTWMQYNYGENYASGSNATFSFTNESLVTSQGVFDARPYILDMEYAFAGALTGTFIPIPQLNRTDADVLLIFLIKEQTGYYSAVNDPWFRADVEQQMTSIERGEQNTMITSTYYLAPEPVGVLACASQLQVCNPITHNCSILSGKGLALHDSRAKNIFTARQQAVLDRLVYAGHLGQLMLLASEYLGSSFMVAASLLSVTIGNGLPDNQWVIELNHWMRIGYTFLQITLTWWVTGDGIQLHDQYKVAPDTDSKWMCANQLVQRDDYASFSVLGIALILIIGGIIMLAQLMLNPTANYHRRRMNPGVQDMPPYNAANILQIQRMAFKAQHHQRPEWQMNSPYDIIPVTARDDDRKFEGLSLQAAPAPGEGGSGFAQLSKSSTMAQSTDSEVAKQMSVEDGYVFSYSQPSLNRQLTFTSQNASSMAVEEGYRFSTGGAVLR